MRRLRISHFVRPEMKEKAREWKRADPPKDVPDTTNVSAEEAVSLVGGRGAPRADWLLPPDSASFSCLCHLVSVVN